MTEQAARTVVVGRPGYEGANIRTWVGFKHFMYLAEQAVLAWFREHAAPAGALYHQHGLGLEIVDSSALLPAVLDADDEVTAEVEPVKPGRFSVRLRVERDGASVTVLRGKVTVALVREKDAPATEPEPVAVSPLVVPDTAAARAGERADLTVPHGREVRDVLAPTGSGTFLWTWRARYFHCHYSDRVQHSAYTRAVEEVVDRMLADRGLSVATMLSERGWIPVVSRVRVRVLADAHMEEDVHTTFTVTDILRETTYDGRMDCYVLRGNELVHVATASIMHGYAVSRGERAGQLAELDPACVAALKGVS
jgi:acyl-CoA thioesterase FadM